MSLYPDYPDPAPLGDGPAIWSDDTCLRLNAGQHRLDRHPYTCGTDSRHRPLIATRFGWVCADCGYRQGWAHGAPSMAPPPPAAR